VFEEGIILVPQAGITHAGSTIGSTSPASPSTPKGGNNKPRQVPSSRPPSKLGAARTAFETGETVSDAVKGILKEEIAGHLAENPNALKEELKAFEELANKTGKKPGAFKAILKKLPVLGKAITAAGIASEVKQSFARGGYASATQTLAKESAFLIPIVGDALSGAEDVLEISEERAKKLEAAGWKGFPTFL